MVCTHVLVYRGGHVVGIGILGSGFISDQYVDGLQDVRNAELVANYSRSLERAQEFAARWNRPWGPIPNQYDDIEALCADPAVELVIIALPNEVHVEAVRIAAKHGKGIICTKPLARTGAEAKQILEIVKDAGVW